MTGPRDRAGIVDAIARSGVIAVIRLADGRELREVADALLEGGVRALEVTMTVPNAVARIEELAASLPSEALLGAGTVLDVDTARAVIRAGARFVVSPVFRRALIDECHDHAWSAWTVHGSVLQLARPGRRSARCR